MITLKTLKWSNLFSYGKDNVIQFDKDPIVQLVGKNGHGKSSIALILEEVLFNKNSKGIKKADILNRHTKDKNYTIELEFEKDGSVYQIKTVRGTSQTVTVCKDEDNISAHTATATFKLIEEILGFDHKTFSQLVYQSSASSLEFLTATDTNRKKFLIELLNLSKYIEAFEVFKASAKAVSEDLLVVETKVKTTQTWLDKSAKENLVLLPVEGLPFWADDPSPELHESTSKLSTIDATNKKISQNELYKQQLASIPIETIAKTVQIQSDKELLGEIGELRSTVKSADAMIKKVSGLEGECPTCLQSIDTVKINHILVQNEEIKNKAETAIKELNAQVSEIAIINAEAKRITKLKSDWETYHSLVDNTLPTDPLDAENLQKRISELSKTIAERKKLMDEAIAKENKTATHNSKVKVILEQMESMKADLTTYSMEVASLSGRLNLLQILQKTFSTNGLIAYKIECLVKDLEVLTNEYLTELSSGRFQLTFKVSTGDKLNVIITDNGKDIDMLALSGGERARVNTATLLAIRRLMQSLSNARINLLILDETIDNLDQDGKEKLVEVLLKEEHLNTFMISHGFTHPLLEKILVIKENNISRLE